MKRKLRIIIIVFLIFMSIIIVSSPLFSLANGKKIGILANYYKELPIEVSKGTFESLMIIDENEALSKVNPTPILYENPNGFDKEIDVMMVISKNSSINYLDIELSINDNIIHLKDLVFDYDENYYYFKIGTKKIMAYSNSQDLVRIWLNKNVSGLTEESEMTFNFITKE